MTLQRAGIGGNQHDHYKVNSPLSVSLKRLGVELNGCYQHSLLNRISACNFCANKGGTVDWFAKPLHPLAYLLLGVCGC